ncbi:MAG: diguanylate cyclase (GGDEF domain) [uncultured Pseudonocardia sp.]|uniref:Diguanylate cyclase (GGDEF domain) n=1 Tax=uncultured Pseudonocardia sp. TaxID=211455 RepID=A0A6J4QGG6_9PSEU|nr:MAG: diguanylate cyclase (GGDEF domain) [uncultured Pseudonocardia sp.]
MEQHSAGRSPGDERAGLAPRLIPLVLGVEVLALVTVVQGVLDRPVGGTSLLLAVALATLSVVHTELATGIERARRRAGGTSYSDLSSVWTFAAALLLPPAAATLVVLVVYGHLWVRVWSPAGVPLHRHVYTTAAVLLAVRAAHEVAGVAGGLPGSAPDTRTATAVALAVVAYAIVNTALVGAAVALARPGAPLADVLGRWDDNALEVATLCMGALAAVALGAVPGLVVLVLPPILVLHRAVLARQLEDEVSTDAKTGLLTAAAWQEHATRSVRAARRAGTGAGLLILDLDHFKGVNDTWGHLAGDAVLAAVAAELREGVRDRDLVGRFGGEEFVVLLPDLPPGPGAREELWRVADRLRRRIERMDVGVDTSGGAAVIAGLSVSIGGATVPADGTTLDQVLHIADRSLYAAKDAGRNTVRIAAEVTVPAPRRAAE